MSEQQDEKSPIQELTEQTNAALASWQAAYSHFLGHPFTRKLMEYAMDESGKTGSAIINSLDPNDQAKYRVLEKLANGLYFRDAFLAECGRIKAGLLSAVNAAKREHEDSRGAALGDGLPGD